MERCRDGECIGDPCRNVECPPGQRCLMVNDIAQCIRDLPGAPGAGVILDPGEDDGDDFDGAGGRPGPGGEGFGPQPPMGDPLPPQPPVEGCHCDALDSEGGAGGWWALLLLLGLRRRR